MIANRPSKHGVARFEGIEHGAERGRAGDIDLHIAAHACQRAEMRRQFDPDHDGSVCTSTDSTGGKSRLLGMSKHGDSYLRKLLVHGARSCLRWVGRKRDRRSQWVQSLMERRGWNRAAVALANKNARVAWVLMCTEQVYETAVA